jgi:hypothetical protein
LCCATVSVSNGSGFTRIVSVAFASPACSVTVYEPGDTNAPRAPNPRGTG